MSNDEPRRIDHRNTGQKAAIVLVHGFTGDTRATWGSFVDLLLAEPSIKTWDLFGLGYPSSLRIDVPNFWAADPDIASLALELKTTLSLTPFKNYAKIAIAAHSMGGLVVQRAILDDERLRKERISHLFLFGTPSAGLTKARFFIRLKPQIADMVEGGDFIRDLRKDWDARITRPLTFFFRTIAGNRDEFVPRKSSIMPFLDEFRAVVPGNHLEIVKPQDNMHPSFLLVVDALAGEPGPGGPDLSGGPRFDGALLAIELGKFQKAVDILEPNAALLDADALGSLALALEGLGRGDEALALLEKYFRGGVSSTDAQGILAGRLKRRWLVERRKDDIDRARELYLGALTKAEKDKNHSQAYYHAINVAFLDLVSSAPPKVPSAVQEMAKRALGHCASAGEENPPDRSNWRFATEAEAFLMLGELDKAETQYRRAKQASKSPREIDPMYLQAIRVATRVFDEEGATRIEKVFGLQG